MNWLWLIAFRQYSDTFFLILLRSWNSRNVLILIDTQYSFTRVQATKNMMKSNIFTQHETKQYFLILVEK